MSQEINQQPQRQLVKSAQTIDLGIIELDDRLEFSLDPLSQLALAPSVRPTNGNCNGCNAVFLC
jgi:hypothetical protein